MGNLKLKGVIFFVGVKKSNRRATGRIFQLFFLFLLIFAIPILHKGNFLPKEIYLWEGADYTIQCHLPIMVTMTSSNDGVIVNETENPDELPLNLLDPITISPKEEGNTELSVKLFGLIPLQSVMVDVLPELRVVPGGHSVGMKLKSEGVMVIGYSDILIGGRSQNPAKSMGIEVGDTILEINDQEVKNLDHAAYLINQNSSEPKEFLIEQGDQEKEVIIEPTYCEEEDAYRIGLTIRDTAAGIGTLTFYDPNATTFGALGHSIVDSETSELVDVKLGEILSANIVSIEKGEEGTPGEKRGAFHPTGDVSGSLFTNTDFGVFGTLHSAIENPYYEEPIPVGYMSEVEVGPATIYTVVSGEEIEAFDIMIEKTYPQSNPSTKGMLIRVTDEDLIQRTGGIVQGMSGSPIIQNGKLIGAVTHVLVNDPTKGYGIFIESMLESAESINQ